MFSNHDEGDDGAYSLEVELWGGTSLSARDEVHKTEDEACCAACCYKAIHVGLQVKEIEEPFCEECVACCYDRNAEDKLNPSWDMRERREYHVTHAKDEVGKCECDAGVEAYLVD